MAGRKGYMSSSPFHVETPQYKYYAEHWEESSRRIKKGENKIKTKEMTKPDIDEITVGSKVILFHSKLNKEVTYNIVVVSEADPFKNKISNETPMGKCLIGHKKGDKVSFEAPSGIILLKIIDIKNDQL